MLDITEELKNYIELVGVNLYYYFIWDNTNLKHLIELRELADLNTSAVIGDAFCKTEEIDIERRKNIKIAIVSLIKIYKNIPLTEEENLLLNKYPLEDTSDELENKIACIVYKISKEAREKVNKIRLDMDTYLKPVNRKDGIFRTPPSEIFRNYLGCLDEYNDAFLHAWIGNSKFYLFNPVDRKSYSPTFDFNSDCFIEFKSNAKKLFPFFKRLRKK